MEITSFTAKNPAAQFFNLKCNFGFSETTNINQNHQGIPKNVTNVINPIVANQETADAIKNQE